MHIDNPNTGQPPKKFLHPRGARLTGTAGHTVILKPNVPTNVPERLWLEAARSGCMEFDPDTIRAAAAALEQAASEDAPEPKRDPKHVVRAAVQAVLQSGDASALKGDGVPKVSAVKRIVNDPEIDIKSETVYSAFLDVTSGDMAAAAAAASQTPPDPADIGDLEDPDGIDEQVGEGLAGVLNEGEDGDIDEE